MIRLSMALIILLYSSIAFSQNVDSPGFWDGWQRDDAMERSIVDYIRTQKLTAKALVQKADEDDAEYAFYLGLLYYYGTHDHGGEVFRRDHKKSLKYFSQVKDQPYLMPLVNYYLGMILWNGYDDVRKNHPMSLSLLNKSNTPEAFLMLAAFNYDDPAEQLAWYKKLAYTRDWRAMLTVAHWHMVGRGGSKKIGEALYWYTQACAQRIVYACDKVKQINDSLTLKAS